MLIHSGRYVSPCGTSEKISLVYGVVDTRNAAGVHGNAAELEDILAVLVPAKVFVERVRSGDIRDLKNARRGLLVRRVPRNEVVAQLHSATNGTG